jgi:hypothetical protein
LGSYPNNKKSSGWAVLVTILIILILTAGAGLYLWNVLPSDEDIRWVAQQDAGRIDILQSIQIIDTKKRPSVTTADLRLQYAFHQQMESVACRIRLVPHGNDWRITGVMVGANSFESLKELGGEVKTQLAMRDLAARAEDVGDSLKEGMDKAGETAKEIWEKIKNG